MTLRQNKLSTGQLIKDEKGATMAEFSLVLGLLLIFLLVTATFVKLIHGRMNLEHAIGVTARRIVATGTTVSGGTNYPDRVSAIRADVIRRATGVDGNAGGFSIDPADIFICKATAFNSQVVPPCPNEDAGGPGDVVMLYVRKPINAGNYLFWPEGMWGPAPVFDLGVSAVVRIEPFS